MDKKQEIIAGTYFNQWQKILNQIIIRTKLKNFKLLFKVFYKNIIIIKNRYKKLDI